MGVNEHLPSEQETICLLQSDEMARQANEILTGISALTQTANRALSACEGIQKATFPLRQKKDLDVFRKGLHDFYEEGLAGIYSLYDIITRPNTAGGLLKQKAVQHQNFDEIWEPIEGIYSAVFDGRIFIKLPLLPAKIYHNFRSAAPYTAGKYLRFFSRTLDESLSRIDAEIPHFREQNIMYIFAFPPGKNMPPDCDNYDTKNITDIICMHTMCDDSPNKTSFFYTGIQESDVPKGTYIVVSGNRFLVPNAKKIMGVFDNLKNIKKP